MKQEYKVRKGGRTIINEDGDKAKEKNPTTTPKPAVTKEDDKNADQS